MEHRVFAYGTLRNEELRKELLGYSPSCNKTQLKGFRMESILLDEVEYPILVEDQQSKEIIKGEYFSVNIEELMKLDQYESYSYRRITVILENGLKAWVYCK